jgi:hypothetical protein
MNTSITNHIDLGNLIKVFLKELPEVNSCTNSSIVESFFINGKEIKLKACKNRGMQGFIWNVDILD